MIREPPFWYTHSLNPHSYIGPQASSAGYLGFTTPFDKKLFSLLISLFPCQGHGLAFCTHFFSVCLSGLPRPRTINGQPFSPLVRVQNTSFVHIQQPVPSNFLFLPVLRWLYRGQLDGIDLIGFFTVFLTPLTIVVTPSSVQFRRPGFRLQSVSCIVTPIFQFTAVSNPDPCPDPLVPLLNPLFGLDPCDPPARTLDFFRCAPLAGVAGSRSPVSLSSHTQPFSFYSLLS